MAKGPPVPSKTSTPPAGAATRAAQYKPGQEFDGEVLKITDHGVIVKLAGTQNTGFVHVSEMKDTFVQHPGEEVSEGEQVRVRVLKADPNFLGLTMKNLGRKTMNDFMTGQEVQGRVTQVTAFGAFVDIGADKDCLLHKTQIKDGVYVADAREFFQRGDEVSAFVRRKDESKGRLELSMKPAMEVLMPLQRGQKLANLKEGQEMGGVITSVRKFGVFVDVGAEADGLVHVRNINDGIVSNIDAVVKHGDPVVVKVIGLNNGKLELDLTSPLPRLPAVDAFKSVMGDVWLDGVITGLANFGVFVEVEPPGGGPKVTALLGLSQAKEVEKLYYGEKVSVRILTVDTEKKQLHVTQKQDR